MIRPRQLTPRQWLIVLYDLLATAAALTVTIVIRFENSELAARLAWLPELLAGFVALAAVVYYLTGLHEAKWRFTSMPELKRIIRASAILAIALLALDSNH
jgi:O-antigen biosynthesis protein WbqV